MQKIPHALQVTPGCVSITVLLPSHGLRSGVGSRSRECRRETLKAAGLGHCWGHGFASAAELVCHLGLSLQQTFLRWPFCAVLISGPQRAAET